MSASAAFYRKIAYLALVVALLFPIAWLARPSAKDSDQGGVLAQLRGEHKLGEGDLGEIDPASETMRLATLGLHSIASAKLWAKANHYKKVEDWTAFHATLQQLKRLQPHYINVWRYQAWNLTYNISVELDALVGRYRYVIQGIRYLMDGIRYNRDNPTLLADLGWFIGNKIGRADERKEYRELFRKDDEFHQQHNPNLLPEQRDNWLVSRTWNEEAVRAVDEKLQSLGQKNPTTFYSSPAMSQINYSDAIEDEGTFGTRAKAAWNTAAQLWKAYGNRDLRSSRGLVIRLGDEQRVKDELAQTADELNQFAPGLKERMREEALARLTPEQQRAWKSLPQEPTEEEMARYREAEEALDVTTDEIANRLASENPDKAAAVRRLAARMSDLQGRLSMIETNRDVSNFAYWERRCAFEQTDDALQARELAWQARRAKAAAAIFGENGARSLYERAFAHWANVLKYFPELREDSTTASDLIDVVAEYADVLDGMELSLADEKVADAFPLWDIVTPENDSNRRFVDAIEKREQRLGKGPKSTGPVGAPQINPADVEAALAAPQPETPQPETPQSETPQSETPQSETPQPETPQPETPQPETPQPETPQPETPQPETPSGPEQQATPSTP